MITLKPFLKPGLNGRHILSLQVIIEAPGKPRVSASYIPETAKNLTTPEQGTTLFFSEAYQSGLARFIRVLVPGWIVGTGTTLAQAKPPAPVHQSVKALKQPVANQMIEDLYSGAPRVVPSPAPAENRGQIVTRNGQMVEATAKNSKDAAVASVEELRVGGDGKFINADSSLAVRQNWDARPSMRRRIADLGTLVNKPSRDLIDILHDMGETQFTSHLNVLTPAQAEKIAHRVLGR